MSGKNRAKGRTLGTNTLGKLGCLEAFREDGTRHSGKHLSQMVYSWVKRLPLPRKAVPALRGRHLAEKRSVDLTTCRDHAWQCLPPGSASTCSPIPQSSHSSRGD